MITIDPAPHEFAANLLFNSDGLSPYFACDSEVKKAEGSKTAQFKLDGESWRARLSYQSSNILNPGKTTPQGTEFAIQEVREYRIRVFRAESEDWVGQQSFTAHLAPRWEGMKGEKNDGTTTKIPVPDGFGEGVNVRVQGSNIEFSRYLPLLQEAATMLDINGRYFESPHEYSNIQDAEKYVRLHKHKSGPVHSRDGPIASMGHLLEHDRAGYRKVVQNDDDEKGRNLPGYYHTVTLGPRRVREAFPSHQLPKEIKHYYAREAKDLPDSNPLSHPKLGCSYQASRYDETLHWSDLNRMQRELDQTVLSVLTDAEIDISPQHGKGAYVEDDYFEVELTEETPDPINLNLTRVRQNQESVVIEHIADGLAPTQWDALETLVTDGGEVSPADIAEENDRHVESVRRALRDMEHLVHTEYAKVSVRSEHIAELVHDAVSEAKGATQRAIETAGKAISAAKRGLEEDMSAFVAWAARHGIDVEDSSEARMRLRVSNKENAERAINEGLEIWKKAGMPEERYRSAQVVFEDGGGFSDAWRFILAEKRGGAAR